MSNNTISELVTEDGSTIMKANQLCNHVVSYYDNKFNIDDHPIDPPLFDYEHASISASECQDMDKIPTVEEIKAVVFELDWFKIFTKILATRLGGVLDNLVSEEQIAFIKGRNIHENIIFTTELVNGLQKKRKDGNLGLKLDISQSFDTVRWSFVLEVFRRFERTMMVSTSSNNDYSSISSDEDFKAYAAKSRAKTNYVEGAKASISLNDRRISYEELMKRKTQDDEMEDRRRRKDRIRCRIQAAEERRQFFDGVPSDSDANASEEETVWVVRNYEIKRRTRELQKIAKQVEAELEAEYEEEDDSDSDDPNIHPDFINGRDSDSDEELEEDSAKDDDYESDNSDKSDDSDESDN
ncbi:uncharacterized protein LOC113341887 [Papaver somniferum]|uniref:uncharacterized protein LOC113341887 n=1 Tax=Papaver somniferum TaxID=3469 RepID=UPI000E6FE41C|nr:uncharacterized protein LOC113341887 [Papaver somniferum]